MEPWNSPSGAPSSALPPTRGTHPTSRWISDSTRTRRRGAAHRPKPARECLQGPQIPSLGLAHLTHSGPHPHPRPSLSPPASPSPPLTPLPLSPPRCFGNRHEWLQFLSCRSGALYLCRPCPTAPRNTRSVPVYHTAQYCTNIEMRRAKGGTTGRTESMAPCAGAAPPSCCLLLSSNNTEEWARHNICNLHARPSLAFAAPPRLRSLTVVVLGTSSSPFTGFIHQSIIKGASRPGRLHHRHTTATTALASLQFFFLPAGRPSCGVARRQKEGVPPPPSRWRLRQRKPPDAATGR